MFWKRPRANGNVGSQCRSELHQNGAPYRNAAGSTRVESRDAIRPIKPEVRAEARTAAKSAIAERGNAFRSARAEGGNAFKNARNALGAARAEVGNAAGAVADARRATTVGRIVRVASLKSRRKQSGPS
jgi:hypothetical protein